MDGVADIFLDVCGLEPPEPMERVLDALDALAPHQQLRMLIDREPRPLYRILERNGYRYQVGLRADGLFVRFSPRRRVGVRYRGW
jgi:uncharacterized protein (DUF2249 family)